MGSITWFFGFAPSQAKTEAISSAPAPVTQQMAPTPAPSTSPPIDKKEVGDDGWFWGSAWLALPFLFVGLAIYFRRQIKGWYVQKRQALNQTAPNQPTTGGGTPNQDKWWPKTEPWVVGGTIALASLLFLFVALPTIIPWPFQFLKWSNAGKNLALIIMILAGIFLFVDSYGKEVVKNTKWLRKAGATIIGVGALAIWVANLEWKKLSLLLFPEGNPFKSGGLFLLHPFVAGSILVTIWWLGWNLAGKNKALKAVALLPLVLGLWVFGILISGLINDPRPNPVMRTQPARAYAEAPREKPEDRLELLDTQSFPVRGESWSEWRRAIPEGVNAEGVILDVEGPPCHLIYSFDPPNGPGNKPRVLKHGKVRGQPHVQADTQFRVKAKDGQPTTVVVKTYKAKSRTILPQDPTAEAMTVLDQMIAR
jgi:hypothetical protein